MEAAGCPKLRLGVGEQLFHVGRVSRIQPGGAGLVHEGFPGKLCLLHDYRGKASLRPPSTGNIAPVVLEDLSQARNRTASATSSE